MCPDDAEQDLTVDDAQGEEVTGGRRIQKRFAEEAALDKREGRARAEERLD